MAYIQDTYYLGDYIATEIKFIGRNGAKGERRAKKIKATPEQMARQNQWTREKKEKYLILANFRTGDVWVTLKYPRGTRPDSTNRTGTTYRETASGHSTEGTGDYNADSSGTDKRGNTDGIGTGTGTDAVSAGADFVCYTACGTACTGTGVSTAKDC